MNYTGLIIILVLQKNFKEVNIMAEVLYVYANPKPIEVSFTLRLAKVFFDEYKKHHPDDKIVSLNLYKEEIPFVDEGIMKVWGMIPSSGELTADEKSKLLRLNELTDQFIRADKVVIAAPMWNFSYPPMLKAYIDTIMVAGKTFKYTETGPVGLLKDKPVLHIQARGGIYSEGPMKSVEHTESYLKDVMNFIGISNFQTVVCEGIAIDPGRGEEIFNEVANRIAEVAKKF